MNQEQNRHGVAGVAGDGGAQRAVQVGVHLCQEPAQPARTLAPLSVLPRALRRPGSVVAPGTSPRTTSSSIHRGVRSSDQDPKNTSVQGRPVLSACPLLGNSQVSPYGVSKAIFASVDYHAWGRLMRWIRAKFKGKTQLGMREMRRRFCDKGWRFAHKGVVFTGASSVRVTRYRYRGSKIPTPWTFDPAAVASG
jgi:hypothetical protein